MIEINIKAKGENIEDLARHLNMIKTLIELRKYDNPVQDCNNKGNTKTSSYEYSIASIF